MDLVHLQKSLRFGWGQLVFKGPGKREMSGGSDVRNFSLCRIVPEAMYWERGSRQESASKVVEKYATPKQLSM